MRGDPSTVNENAPKSDAVEDNTKATAFRLFLSEARAEIGALHAEHAAAARVFDPDALDALFAQRILCGGNFYGDCSCACETRWVVLP